MSAAHQLLALAQEELTHALGRRWEALDAVHERRLALMAELPLQLGAEDRRALEDAQQVHAAVAQLLREGLDETRAHLVALGRGRTAVQAYAAS